VEYAPFIESLRAWENRARAALVIDLALRGMAHGTVRVFPAQFVEDGAWVRWTDLRMGRDHVQFVGAATLAAVTREQLTATDLWLHTSSEPPPPEEQRPAWAEWWP
jgi:hypothetical protein